MHVVPGSVMMRFKLARCVRQKGKGRPRRAGPMRHGCRQPCAAQEAPGRQKGRSSQGARRVRGRGEECTLCAVTVAGSVRSPEQVPKPHTFFCSRYPPAARSRLALPFFRALWNWWMRLRSRSVAAVDDAPPRPIDLTPWRLR